MNNLLNLFIDQFQTNLVLIPHDSYMLQSILFFDAEPKNTILIISLLAALSAQILNFTLGRVFFTIYLKVKDATLELRFFKLQKIISKYSQILAFSSWLAIIGGFLILLLGFTKVSFKQFITWTSFGYLLYFSYIIYF